MTGKILTGYFGAKNGMKDAIVGSGHHIAIQTQCLQYFRIDTRVEIFLKTLLCSNYWKYSNITISCRKQVDSSLSENQTLIS